MSMKIRCQSPLDNLPSEERYALERLVDAQIDAYLGTNPVKRARRLAGLDRQAWLVKAADLHRLMGQLVDAHRRGRLKPVRPREAGAAQ